MVCPRPRADHGDTLIAGPAGPTAFDLERGLYALALAVAALFVVSLGFAIVALALRFKNDRAERRSRALSETWEPRMLDVLAGTADDSAVLAHVAPDDAAAFLSFLLGYARRLQGEEREIVRRLARPYLARLATRASHGSAEARALHVQILAEMGLPEHADAVAAALDDRSPIVAMIAARGLFRPGYREYFGTVLRNLGRFTPWSRSYLTSMLVKGGSETTPMLRAILADPAADSLNRALAADALRLLHDLAAVPVAAEVLRDVEGQDREVVAACIRILRHMGQAEHLPLIRPLVSVADPVIRAAAVGALGAIGGPDDVPILQDVLDDVAYWVSLEAARGLLALGAADTLRRLASSQGPWSILARQVLTE